MATLCNRCGQPLPREDARFCNRCGADMLPKAGSPPIPRRTQVITDQNSSPASGRGARPALREQIAFAPPSPPVAPGDVPPWLSRLDKMSASPIAKPRIQNFSPDTPPGVESSPETGRPASPGGSHAPQRELRARVWEGDGANSPDLHAPVDVRDRTAAPSRNDQQEEQAQVPPAPPQQRAEEPSGVEDRPTVPVPSAPAGKKDGSSPSPAVRAEQFASGNPHAGEGESGGADLPTRPLMARLSVPEQVHPQRSSERPFPAQSYRQPVPVPPQSLPGQKREPQQGFAAQPTSNPGQPLTRQQPVMSPVPLSSPGFQQPVTAQAPATIERTPTPVPARPVRRKSRMRLVVVLVMLFVLLGGGLIYWIVAYQPFSVPAVTSTSLPFSNASLGIALQYPQGWTSRLDAAHQTATFFDAGHVDQLTISAIASSGTSASAYASKEAAQLGLTAQKNLSPITFAGTVWQRVQGTLLVSGATDTETVLVAQHGNRLYTIAQIAPAVTYAGADGLFFAVFRAHFQFL